MQFSNEAYTGSMMSFDNVLYDNLEADPVLMQPLDFPIDDKQPLPEVKYRVDLQDITLGGVGQGILVKWVVGVESRTFPNFLLPSIVFTAASCYFLRWSYPISHRFPGN